MGIQTITGSYNMQPAQPQTTTEEMDVEDRDYCTKVDRVVYRRSMTFVYWALTVSFIGCTISGKIPPQRLSFPCNEQEVIVRPFHTDTISGLALFVTLLLAPFLVFAFTESLVDAQEEIRTGFRRSWLVLNDYISGFFYVFIITELLKVVVSEQRPHFFYTCKPDWDSMKCSNGLATEYNCTGDGPWWLVQVDIFKSFPSGHASFSFYAFVFVSVYVHFRISKYRSTIDFIRPWIQLFFLCWTLVCCFTRITDNRHYWWDVLAGVFIGMMVALYMIKFSECKTFTDLVQNSETDDTKQTLAKSRITPTTTKQHIAESHMKCDTE